MDDLLTQYDVIVVGTGMTESILAAALSRVGKSVLHMDSNDYYGENWASFNFDGIQNWIKKSHDSKNKHNNCDIANEITHRIDTKPNISNINENWYKCTKLKKTEGGSVVSSDGDGGVDCDNDKNRDLIEKATVAKDIKSCITRESRRFNLDLCPKVLFSRGPIVDLLISSNIARYAEFKSVSRVLTWRNECLELVPCSRADVFSTKNITVVEKRLLVKILTLFSNYPDNSEEFKGFENKTFIDYLKYKKLPSNLIHYIVYAMAMGDKNTLCLEGVKASKSFLESLGRYGNTPFIFPMYGSGELPQCFCRLCAVFGGVYYLKREIEGIVTEGDRCKGIMSENKLLNADIFVFSSKYFPSELVTSQKGSTLITRGIFITDRSILASEKEQVTLLLFPPVPNISENSVTVIELGPGTCTCPEKFYVVHMTALATSHAAADLKHVVEALFRKESSSGREEKEEEGEKGEKGEKKEKEEEEEEEEGSEKPRILWSLTWNVKQETAIETRLENVKVCSGPDAELDYKFSIEEAKKLFGEVCPGEEFLPRVPDPDEIILEFEKDENATEAREEPREENKSISE